MKITTIKTEKILPGKSTLYQILNKYLPTLKENSILAITSKVVSICEGRVVKHDTISKEELTKREADYILQSEKSPYGIYLTLKNNILIPNAGIDESNGGGFYILWPKDAQKTANEVKTYLQKKFKLKNIGVIITDSKTSPLRWGTTGIAIAYSGFSPLNNYIGEPDIFGKKLRVTKANIMDGLAASCVLVMGEGREQTPLAVVEDLTFVKFQEKNPSRVELRNLNIAIEEDLYAPLLKKGKWEKQSK